MQNVQRALEFAADAFDPLLAFLALGAPFLERPRRPWPGVVRYLIGAAAGLAFVYLIAAADLLLGLWASWGLDYSTHTAFAVSLAMSICRLDRRWLLPLAAALLVFAGLLLHLGYHSVPDMTTSALVAASGTWTAHRMSKTPRR